MNVSQSSLLLILLLLPLVGAGAVATLKENARAAKAMAMVFALAELALTAVAWFSYSIGLAYLTRFQLVFDVPWIPAFGTRLSLGVDGIALVMLALIAVLVPIVMGSSWADRLPEGRSAAGFYSLLLATQGLLVGVFAATDVFLFYVFFEAMLVPMYFLIGRFGGPKRQYAAVKFFLYSLLGGLIMLGSVIGLYVVSADRLPTGGTFSWTALQSLAASVPESVQIWLFLGFFVAFAIKAPLVPLHTWLPDAGAEAPIGAGVLLVGVLDKVATFGFLRYCLPLFPAASKTLAPLVLVLSVIGIIYAALLAVGQDDMKRFVSYTSIAHFGFISLGIFAFSSQAFAGSVLYMVNHGITTGMLFITVGMLIARGESRLISDYGGVSKLTPALAGSFLVAGLASLALPGTNSFVSEFLVLIGSFPREPVYTIIATVGIIFAALYVLWVYQRLFQGPVRGNAVLASVPGPGSVGDPAVRGAFADLTRREIGVLVPLVALVLAIGFFPGPVLDVINPSVTATMHEVGLPDPVGGLK
ncbi:NADH-quinone oxidoreductase subunit M [Pseudonocardia acaciae]|uniref:NADH-quinone oxidoreductase subunit M n=1 Tax=Pseudonocardia acaciae TaxID=551276 RepID=UPI000ABBFCAE|nr:NADH-quinone oxidoreductase subunit M [Pseudonocardia acaciae]